MNKEARGFTHDPKFVAEQIRDIIDVMIGRMKLESQQGSYTNLREKIRYLNVAEISNKKQPGGASIGMSISLIKNILNGRDPYFVKMVMDELTKGL